MVTPLSIDITENAAKHVREFTGKTQGDTVSLRVAVRGGGCSGLTYDLAVDDDQRDTDRVIEQRGVTIMIDKKSYIFLAGHCFGLLWRAQWQGICVQQPNAKTVCGCGTSFSV